MDKLRVASASLTIIIGCALFLAGVGIDYPLADGDGGILTPGIILAILFGGAPIITGIDALRQRLTDRSTREHQSQTDAV